MHSQERLITNSQKGNLLNELKKSLEECRSFYFSVAFINFSGLQLILDSLKNLEKKGIRGKIITSTYLNFTEPKALEKIKEFSNIDLKVFVTDKDIGFHTKVYIFEYEDNYKVIIGSSNITQSALKSNVEWNVEIISKREQDFIKEVLLEYENLWNCTEVISDDFLNRYKNFIDDLRKHEKIQEVFFDDFKQISPNKMQKRAMENLHRLRSYGESKALVIAATGTGKTYMSAFDVKNYKPKRMLFIVHREEILTKAKETFEKLIDSSKKYTGLYTGNIKEKDALFLFATIQTMSRHFEQFPQDCFDYIIIDEAHHASSPSYQNILEYFRPEFLLGMTATPERSDSNNIFELFNNNVALEVRLHEALEDDLVIPFHYFGVTDIEGIDLNDVDIDNIAEVTKRLKVNERVDFIIEKMNFYGYDGKKRKALGFCAGIEHAQYMADEFNKRGIKSVCLTGENSIEERISFIDKLESEDDDLEVIFTVDIFNEGVDIPSINSVLMLRPTNSPIIFIQQLGRGLRKYGGKEFLTVLDFIGNHSKTFLIAIALNGSRYYDKDSLRVAVATDFANIPGCTHIQMDSISKERILRQIDQENFNAMKYLKEEYFEFKKLNNMITPLLVDYIRYDGAPDPIKFIDKEGTYLDFVSKVEKDNKIKELLSNNDFEAILVELSGKLPIKRVHEFSILKYLMNNGDISKAKAKDLILKHAEKVDDDTLNHTFEYLNQDYYDSRQIDAYKKLVNYNEGKLFRSETLTKVLENKEFKKYIEDIINYGIFRYEKEFGETFYGVPHFKLYYQYQMVDTALLSNYRKKHSSFRGAGIATNGKEFFLFIDLHKEEDIKESINYKDKFINQRIFQWQTQNSTSPDSERGKDIIFNKNRGVNLHLFVRKYRTIDDKVEPYIYIGKGNTIEYEGEKPITTKIELEHEVPTSIYIEFTKKV
jgi:superfamily II DNA or RNA helicase/HKD family nuclease